jgi:hypothetical protein
MSNLGLFKLKNLFRNQEIKIIEVFSQIEKSDLLGKIVRPGNFKSRIDLTQNDALLQVSAINFARFQEVKKHKHLPLHRETVGTSEIWLVTKGKFLITVFDTDDSKLGEFKIGKGELVVFFGGGHSLTAKSNGARILEIKNGPYKGADLDKVYI